MLNIFLIVMLLLSFMKFSLQCAPKDQLNQSVNNMFSLALDLSNIQPHKLDEDCINKIGLLLIEPLNHGINIFRMNDFIPLMNFLNYKNKKNLGIKLIKLYMYQQHLEIMN